MTSSSLKLGCAVAVTALGLLPLAVFLAWLTVPNEIARTTLVAEYVLCLLLGGLCMLLGYMNASVAGNWHEPNSLIRYGAGLAAVGFGCLSLSGLLW